MWDALIALGGAIVVSGLLKIVTDRKSWEPFRLGGMPSTHAAVVGALVMSVWFEQGISLLFAIVLGFGALVLRDAFGVRWEVTRHSEALNRLTKSNLYKVAGHTKVQVVVGVFVGALCAVAVYLWI